MLLQQPQSNSDTSRLFIALGVLVVLIGVAVRLIPLFDVKHWLFWYYMTEDGYLLQTVARNMAMGLGMSTSAGTIPTNGVQPLFTLLSALAFWLVGANKVAGIVLVTMVSTLIGLGAMWLVWRIARRVLPHILSLDGVAFLLAALWFSAPDIVYINMNGLETGLYWLCLLAALDYYLSIADKCWQIRQRVWLGVLLGLTFLARNDAVFFIAALLATHLVLDKQDMSNWQRRIFDVVTAGVVSILVGMPWLVNNWLKFGSIVPISGKAESAGIVLGQNLPSVPAVWLNSTLLYFPVPSSMLSRLPLMLIALLGVTAVISIFWKTQAVKIPAAKRMWLVTFLLLLALTLYYGMVFGAPWFLPRYFSPVSPMLWIMLVGIFFSGFQRVAHTKVAKITVIITVLLALMSLGFYGTDLLRGHSRGSAIMHKQVVDWVAQHVPERDWVGAVQTGTLGYFHDRTINLDGKVNPYALRAKLQQGDVIDYVLQSPIVWLVDWNGIVVWHDAQKYPEFTKEFNVLVNDKEMNIGVLVRKQDASLHGSMNR